MKETKVIKEIMAKSSKKMIKIIYFDEGSATDLIYVLDGGKSSNKKENIINKTTELAAGAEMEAGKSIGLLSMISAKMGVDANADFSREGTTIISKAVENTILTDYLNCVDKDGKSYITVFPECKPYPYPNSFAYFKMLTPYLTMTDGRVQVAEDLNLNLALMDQALNSGRGYYELITEHDGQSVVLRFNIKAFRNNYFISDLVKMNLEYHAIEVGVVREDSLSMKSEFSESQEAEINGYNLAHEEDKKVKTNMLKVYDVILAGVCR